MTRLRDLQVGGLVRGMIPGQTVTVRHVELHSDEVASVTFVDGEGKVEQAAYLRGEWEKKVRFFLWGDKYPWTSEMPVDSTAFESTYAIAEYALGHELSAATDLWTD